MGEINDTLCDYFGIAEHCADFWNGTEFWQREPVMASRLTRCDREYYNSHRERFQQLDELSIRAMGVLIGREDLNFFPQEEGGLDMCKAFQDAIEEGRIKGHVEAIKSLMENLKFTAEQAMDALSIPKSEQAEYMSLI